MPMKQTTKNAPPGKRHYWLFKSEPDAFSIDDLAALKGKTTCWDGVRNYQARNMLRDEIQVGDGVLFYHSRSEPMSIVGTCEVVKPGYADDTACDPNDLHYDPKSDPEHPIWYMVDIRLKQIFPKPLTRDQIRDVPLLQEMMLLKRGSRLSIQPVTESEWKAIHKLAGVNEM
jgi:predicted RNA-binding protein with PUA-like domain